MADIINDESVQPSQRPSHVVGIGASAGGLEPLQQFFEHLPAKSGMAFVVVQHLSPNYKSFMAELLAKQTVLPIESTKDGAPLLPDHVYLLPPNKSMQVKNWVLQVEPRDLSARPPKPIDTFLHSLAEDAGRRAIAVILSGSGSDGARGALSVHHAGGLVIAQSETTAAFDSMPRSAIEIGAVDLTLAPDQIPLAVANHAGIAVDATRLPAPVPLLDATSQIFALLRERHQVDFTHYKTTTIWRRINRRLQFKSMSLDDYMTELSENSAELDKLYRDLLVEVTSFFRDPGVFAELRACIDRLIAELPENEEFRAWVAGCATGQEAYTVAILVREAFRAAGRPVSAKIFATDVHTTSLDQASVGIYTEDNLQSLPEQFRHDYFVQRDDHYQVSNDLRSILVFAPHNVIRDAPFTRLHLVSCRNLLIYLQPVAQKKALSLLHFGLRVGGVLLLGPSESPGEFTDCFDVVSENSRIYFKNKEKRLMASLPAAPQSPRLSSNTRPLNSRHETRLQRARELLLERSPPAVLLDGHRDITHTLNGGSHYLSQREGRASLHILDLIHPDFKLSLPRLLDSVAETQESASAAPIPFATDGETQRMVLSVLPVTANEELNYLLIFETVVTNDVPVSRQPPGPEVQSERHQWVERELEETKAKLQATIEQMDANTEELQATNEELTAANEELQSTNEELHSLNEELFTVNSEHQAKIQELSELTHDMDHLLESTEVHTIFLDRELRVRRFTPKVGDAFNFLPRDRGRSIEDFTHNLGYKDIPVDLARVLETGKSIDREVTGPEDKIYLLRLRPYCGDDQTINGVVLTLIDISELKHAEKDMRLSEQRYRALVRASADMLWITNASGAFAEPQPEWERYTGQSWESHQGFGWLQAIHPDDRDDIQGIWRHAVAIGSVYSAEGRLWSVKHRQYRRFHVRAAPLRGDDGEIREWVGNVADVQARWSAERELRRKETQLASIMRNASAFIYLKDEKGRYLATNQRFATWLGRSSEEIHGCTDFDIFPTETAERMRLGDKLAMSGELFHEDEEIEYEGREVTWLTTKFPVKDEDGATEGVAGISTDITERTLAEGRREIELERRDRFLAMLSHELRNPLAGITSAVGVLSLAGKEKLPPPALRAFEVLKRQTSHMAHLLDDLLDVTRFVRDRLSLHRVLLDLREVVEAAVTLVTERAQTKNITLSLELPPMPVPLHGDALRLQQVIVNLLTNAVKFTPAGGRVGVVLVSTDSENVLTVEDSGVGMSDAELERAFELFYQGDESLDRPDSGMGVGLALVRRLVLMHEGEVSAASPGPNQGCVFTVRLPRMTNAPTQTSDSDGGSLQPPAARPRILIIEDIEDTRAMVAEYLEALGYVVTQAADGNAGLAKLLEERPQVALIDLGLPGISGFEVAKQVRDSPNLSETWLVAITGYGRHEDRQAALEAGFDEHLVKPVALQRLHKLIAARIE
ncbi:chemotaxis protein CheB [Haliangium ochraceum]|uniref:histidine kinase n=1 Tax=Haliangium ochraceum (strain DSM 14365 / JCM 11303 / SMP-2) TaxID=502025 RepID=D0LRA2_HALO1|nr:chemotaxis protein CheB [Haliangium ochraceum]ACY17130.1 signal transduction histidine kinase with CheB and CheR activity [Haliangium ochraceum DSM 14365]